MSESNETWKIKVVALHEYTPKQLLNLIPKQLFCCYMSRPKECFSTIILALWKPIFSFNSNSTQLNPNLTHLNSTSTKFQLNLSSASASNQPQLQSQPQLNLISIWLWHKRNSILLPVKKARVQATDQFQSLTNIWWWLPNLTSYVTRKQMRM